jgi:hypothetical protein
MATPNSNFSEISNAFSPLPTSPKFTIPAEIQPAASFEIFALAEA